MKSFALLLVGACDELLILVTDDIGQIIDLIDNNPPVAVVGGGCIKDGPLAEALAAIDCGGPSIVYGYRVVKLIDGKPFENRLTYWSDYEWGPPGEASQAERDRAWNVDVRRDLIVWMQA